MPTVWFQVHLLNVTHTENGSLIKWAILPDESADYISNTTAMVMLLTMLKYVQLLPFHQLSIVLYLMHIYICAEHNSALKGTSFAASWEIWKLSADWIERQASSKAVCSFLFSSYYFLLTLRTWFFFHFLLILYHWIQIHV